jgi:hypothetical protein
LPANVEAYRNVALVVVTAWLAIEAVVLARRVRAVSDARGTAAQAQIAVLQSRITELEGRRVELERRHAEVDRRRMELETEVRSAAARHGELEAQLRAAVQRQGELGAAYEDAREKLARVEQDLKEKLAKPADTEVLNLLSLLQLKGRFIDFVMDDITKYPDAQVGAAARVVHQGCAQVVREYFDIKPVREETEGAALTLDKDYDARSYRLLGRVTGEPPFRGRLLHRGWLTTTVRLPEPVVQKTPSGAQPGRGIIAPAEVELN